jgi:hypothetical protein
MQEPHFTLSFKLSPISLMCIVSQWQCPHRSQWQLSPDFNSLTRGSPCVLTHRPSHCDKWHRKWFILPGHNKLHTLTRTSTHTHTHRHTSWDTHTQSLPVKNEERAKPHVHRAESQLVSPAGRQHHPQHHLSNCWTCCLSTGEVGQEHTTLSNYPPSNRLLLSFSPTHIFLFLLCSHPLLMLLSFPPPPISLSLRHAQCKWAMTWYHIWLWACKKRAWSHFPFSLFLCKLCWLFHAGFSHSLYHSPPCALGCIDVALWLCQN